MYQLEKMIAEQGDKMADDDRQPIEAAMEKVRETAKQDDAEAIKSAAADLEEIAQAFSKTLYEKGAAAGSEAKAGAPVDDDDDGDEDAIDAEFEVQE